MVSATDRRILQDLGYQIADIASFPEQAERIDSWKALNGLRPQRPMVMIDQIPWHEMDVDSELLVRSRDPWARTIEEQLRRTLYRWHHMPGDMVVEAVLDVPMAIHGAGYGPVTKEQTAVTDPANDVVGHLYVDQIRNEDELYEKVTIADVYLDEVTTARAMERALEVFDGILDVRAQGARQTFAAYDRIVTWRSAESVLWDLADRPEFTHKIIAHVTDIALDLLDRLESQGLLCQPMSLVHCTGAWSDELPAADFDARHPRAKDLWTYGMAQIFSSVSPAMHKEFWLDYATRWFDRFGLGYYGCCEPLEHKVDLIRALPNVRKISMSPFVDVEAGAEAIGGDYVFSRKPPPSMLAAATWDAQAVRDDLQHTLDACERHGCPVELILKDISTVRYEPQRLWEWHDIACEMTEQPVPS